MVIEGEAYVQKLMSNDYLKLKSFDSLQALSLMIQIWKSEMKLRLEDCEQQCAAFKDTHVCIMKYIYARSNML